LAWHRLLTDAFRLDRQPKPATSSITKLAPLIIAVQYVFYVACLRKIRR
jgi:hypothetical protein